MRKFKLQIAHQSVDGVHTVVFLAWLPTGVGCFGSEALFPTTTNTSAASVAAVNHNVGQGI